MIDLSPVSTEPELGKRDEGPEPLCQSSFDVRQEVAGGGGRPPA